MKIDINIAQNLTQDEKELFAILREVVAKYTPSTQIFAVGGWTRDKLIGIKSDDIDIMLSNIPGEDFARMVTQHMDIKDAHTIKSNPEKSKHITTSKAYIPLSSGKVQEVDFAQARQEVYKEDSRIPEIKPATPQEDAHRRDLTINSCFYDIMKNKLEDFTGMGIKDLVSSTIRTPEDPLKTFSEDPLRIFRTIRFSAKYNGNIDPETYKAMTNPLLRNEIKQKVSKERIGIEFTKTLKNPNPEVALKLLKDTGLWQDIIEEAVRGTKYEGKMAELDLNQQNAHHLLTVWGHTFEVVRNVLNLYPEAEPEKRVTMILAALMHDIGKLYKDIWSESKNHPGSRSYHGHEDESKEISELILKYLKMEPVMDQVSKLAQLHMRPHKFTEGGENSIKAMRRFIRQCGEQSLNWMDVFNLAVADAYSKGLEIDPKTVENYKNLELKLQEALASLKPMDSKNIIKPILDGNEIMQILNIKPGPQMKTITEFVKELRDETPDITKEQAAEMLRQKFNIPNTKNIVASKEKDVTGLCPSHLLKAKIDNINQLFKEKKYYEVFTTIEQLQKEYSTDESIVRLLAITLFKLLVKNEKYRYNDLIQFVLNKAQDGFFDAVLCCHAIGILLLMETATEDNVIKEIAARMIVMSPGTLRSVLDKLPKDIYKSELRREIEKELNANH
jgi:tRNA nucleotidyltransferase/poly(A) polymerase